ncbi:membrane protein [Microbacterium phage Pavlo]|nr:membrane protein [Microbacterium phage Pavlo]
MADMNAPWVRAVAQLTFLAVIAIAVIIIGS